MLGGGRAQEFIIYFFLTRLFFEISLAERIK